MTCISVMFWKLRLYFLNTDVSFLFACFAFASTLQVANALLKWIRKGWAQTVRKRFRITKITASVSQSREEGSTRYIWLSSCISFSPTTDYSRLMRSSGGHVTQRVDVKLTNNWLQLTRHNTHMYAQLDAWRIATCSVKRVVSISGKCGSVNTWQALAELAAINTENRCKYCAA